MFIDVVPNGWSAPAVLLRESDRTNKRIIANLGPAARAISTQFARAAQKWHRHRSATRGLEIQRSLPHGHVAAVIVMIDKLDLPRLLGRPPSRERELALALIASRVLAPASKLATLRPLAPDSLVQSQPRA